MTASLVDQGFLYGDRVRVTEGPYEGETGYVDEWAHVSLHYGNPPPDAPVVCLVVVDGINKLFRFWPHELEAID